MTDDTSNTVAPGSGDTQGNTNTDTQVYAEADTDTQVYSEADSRAATPCASSDALNSLMANDEIQAAGTASDLSRQPDKLQVQSTCDMACDEAETCAPGRVTTGHLKIQTPDGSSGGGIGQVGEKCQQMQSVVGGLSSNQQATHVESQEESQSLLETSPESSEKQPCPEAEESQSLLDNSQSSSQESGDLDLLDESVESQPLNEAHAADQQEYQEYENVSALSQMTQLSPQVAACTCAVLHMCCVGLCWAVLCCAQYRCVHVSSLPLIEAICFIPSVLSRLCSPCSKLVANGRQTL